MIAFDTFKIKKWYGYLENVIFSTFFLQPERGYKDMTLRIREKVRCSKFKHQSDNSGAEIDK